MGQDWENSSADDNFLVPTTKKQDRIRVIFLSRLNTQDMIKIAKSQPVLSRCQL